MEITTKRVSNGIFEVFYKGEKTHFEIWNGCHGYSGKTNIYQIYNRNLNKWKVVGTLAQCKRRLEESLYKRDVLRELYG